jgi:hypothetical protein
MCNRIIITLGKQAAYIIEPISYVIVKFRIRLWLPRPWHASFDVLPNLFVPYFPNRRAHDGKRHVGSLILRCTFSNPPGEAYLGRPLQAGGIPDGAAKVYAFLHNRRDDGIRKAPCPYSSIGRKKARAPGGNERGLARALLLSEKGGASKLKLHAPGDAVVVRHAGFLDVRPVE